jgi:hypothetical protein
LTTEKLAHFCAGCRRAGGADRIETRRIDFDKGHRGGHRAQKFRVWIAGHGTQRHRPDMRRCAAVEPAVGYIKAEHRMGRDYLKGRDGDCLQTGPRAPLELFFTYD